MTSGTGTCSVLFNQAGNTNYNAASQVTETVTATRPQDVDDGSGRGTLHGELGTGRWLALTADGRA